MAIDWDRAIEVATGESLTVITTSDEETVNVSAGKEILYIRTVEGEGGSGEVDWGNIGGVLSAQTDLWTALGAKANTADLGDLAYDDSVDYSDLTNKPTLGTMSAVNDASSDNKTYGRKNGNWVEVTGGGGGGGSTDWDDITNKPSTFPPEAHTHDDRYYTESETNALLADKAYIFDLAPDFDTSRPYSKGSCVIYSGRLYIFTSDKTAGAWDGTKVSMFPVSAIIGIRLAEKQDTLTFDSTPTSGSSNPVTSGGIYTAIHGRALHISMASTSSLGTISNASITTSMRVVNIVWGTPENVLSDVSWNTNTAGQLVLSGTLAGATTAEIDLIDFG